MAYHLAPTLVVLRDEVDDRWPHRDRGSDGWIGDAAHQGTGSDHEPDSDDRSVNALDIDKDGIDPMAVVQAAIKHPSTAYVIFNRQIWSRSSGWVPRRYTGPNPHDKHIHVSVLHTAAEDSTTSWGIANQEDDMSWSEKLKNRDGKSAAAGLVLTDTADRVYTITTVQVPALMATMQAVAKSAGIDQAELAAIQEASRRGALEALRDLPVAEIADQLAQVWPAELAGQVANEIHARLAA